MKNFEVKDHEPSLLPEGKKWSLAWSDEFDGDTLDKSKWLYRLNFWGKPFPAFCDQGVDLDGNGHAVFRPVRMADGRILNLLAEGRLVNLAAGNGHPAEIMDMSFAIQAKGLEYLAKNRGRLENKVYAVPVEIDREVAEIKLRSNGIKIDYLSDEQKAYLEAAE